MSTSDALMSRREVADLLSVSVRTVDRQAREDFEFPCPLSIRSRVLYRRVEIDAYVKARGLTARDTARQQKATLPGRRNAFSPYGFAFRCFGKAGA